MLLIVMFSLQMGGNQGEMGNKVMGCCLVVFVGFPCVVGLPE